MGSLWLGCGLQQPGLPPVAEVELLIPIVQPLAVQQGNLQTILCPWEDLLYRPGAREASSPPPFEGWRLGMELERLSQLAAELSQHRLSPGRFRRALRQERVLRPRHGVERELAGGLRQLLELVDSSPHHETLALIGLDRMIQRLVVLLLCGDLIEATRGEAMAGQSSRSRIFEELLVWIEANLHRPIQLKDLVRQSGYSQRSLRNFFQERFGCGPLHWVRGRRLEAARQRLLDPGPQDTVSSIATAFGYGHLSQFSRDFHRHYRIRPSDLLREGLRGIHAQVCSSAAASSPALR